MGQTLTNGIYLPNEGERNCYSGLAANWNAVDTLKGNYSLHAINVDIHVTAAEKETWNGKADNSALTAHTGDTTIHVTAEDKATWNGKADASALTAHTGNTTIHVTAEDKATWNGKADASALTAHTGDTTIHVTAADKNKWDAVTSKADDSNVVHKGGNETIKGQKTFENNRIVVGSSTDIGSSVHLVNADVVGGNANGSSSFEVYGSSISSDNKIGSLTIGEYSNNGGAYAYIECSRTVNGVKSTNTVRLLIRSDGKKEFAPVIDNDCRSGVPSFRWADVNTVLINGINPGALGLPNYTSRTDISGYIMNITGGNNTYIPPADGFVFVRSDNATYLSIMDIPSGVCQVSQAGTAGTIGLYFPVPKGRGVYIKIVCTSLNIAYFIPSQGNA